MGAASVNTAQEATRPKCAATTLKGHPCKIIPKAGNRYCSIHTISRRENAQWWNSTRVQVVLAIIGVLFGLSYLTARIQYGKEADTKQGRQEADSKLDELVLLGEQLLARKQPEFAKEFPLEYKLIAFGSDAFHLFDTGTTNVFLKVYSERSNYSLRSDDSAITLILPDIDLLSREGKESFTMRGTILELPNRAGAQCIINFDSTILTGLIDVALCGAMKSATKETANIAFDLTNQGNNVRRAQIKRRSLRSANGIITFGRSPDLSFVVEVKEARANGAVIVFGLRPFQPM